MRPSVISIFRNLIRGSPVYVRISSKALVLRDSADGTELSIEPVLLVSGEGTSRRYKLNSISMPFDEQQGVVKRMNGFEHPRTILDDFVVAEQTLKLALNELFKGRKFTPSPILVLHPVEKTEGGLSWIERRGLMELGEGVGGRKIHVWEGRVLSDAELKAGTVFDDQQHTEV